MAPVQQLADDQRQTARGGAPQAAIRFRPRGRRGTRSRCGTSSLAVDAWFRLERRGAIRAAEVDLSDEPATGTPCAELGRSWQRGTGVRARPRLANVRELGAQP